MVVHYQTLAVISVFTCLSLWMYYRPFYITNYANETLPEAQLQQVEHIIVTVKKSKKCFFPYRENQWNLLNEVPEEPVE